jgi:hypothetical protein
MPICVTAAERTHSGLELVDLDAVLASVPDLLLWTIMLERSAASIGGIEEQWLNNRLVELLSNLEGRMPDELEVLEYFEVADRAVSP